MRKFLLPAAALATLHASPRYLYCPFSFHAISPGNLSARFLARPSFSCVDLVDLPLVLVSSSFCFLNRYPVAKESTGNPLEIFEKQKQEASLFNEQFYRSFN